MNGSTPAPMGVWLDSLLDSRSFLRASTWVAWFWTASVLASSPSWAIPTPYLDRLEQICNETHGSTEELLSSSRYREFKAEVERLSPHSSEEATLALFYYIGSCYTVINRSLRLNTPELTQPMTGVLLRFFEGLPPYRGTVHRWITPYTGLMEGLRSARTYSDLGFMSTSRISDLQFAHGCIHFVIHTRSGRSIDRINQNEREVIILPQTRFMVTGIRRGIIPCTATENETVVELREVSKAPLPQ